MTDTSPAAKAPTDAAALASATAAAVSGPQSPDNVKVSQPVHSAVWSLFAGLILVCSFAMAVITVLTFPGLAGWDATTQLARIKYLGIMGLIAVGTIPLFAFAIASPWVGRVEASAGNNRVVLDGRPEPGQ